MINHDAVTEHKRKFRNINKVLTGFTTKNIKLKAFILEVVYSILKNLKEIHRSKSNDTNLDLIKTIHELHKKLAAFLPLLCGCDCDLIYFLTSNKMFSFGRTEDDNQYNKFLNDYSEIGYDQLIKEICENKNPRIRKVADCRIWLYAYICAAEIDSETLCEVMPKDNISGFVSDILENCLVRRDLKEHFLSILSLAGERPFLNLFGQYFTQNKLWEILNSDVASIKQLKKQIAYLHEYIKVTSGQLPGYLLNILSMYCMICCDSSAVYGDIIERLHHAQSVGTQGLFAKPNEIIAAIDLKADLIDSLEGSDVVDVSLLWEYCKPQNFLAKKNPTLLKDMYNNAPKGPKQEENREILLQFIQEMGKEPKKRINVESAIAKDLSLKHALVHIVQPEKLNDFNVESCFNAWRELYPRRFVVAGALKKHCASFNPELTDKLKQIIDAMIKLEPVGATYATAAKTADGQKLVETLARQITNLLKAPEYSQARKIVRKSANQFVEFMENKKATDAASALNPLSKVTARGSSARGSSAGGSSAGGSSAGGSSAGGAMFGRGGRQGNGSEENGNSAGGHREKRQRRT